ncbi:flagellar export chaperone FliS [Clostridium niameyense]|uniref:flagellar export chaperone FliS n=1 Tax=Clostridium niameyense TaxID=1622073 RepID=UPI00067EF161|nr:flagellar export chaperone FliS [Clostridium niameyense]
MYSANAYNIYKNNSVNFASKEQLLLMLLDGTVKFSKRARQAILDKDIPKAHENLVKTQNIYYELMTTLDVQKGGDWTKRIMSLYDYIVRRLTDANLKKDVKIMDEVIPLIEEIRNMWNEAYKLSKRTQD